MVGKLRLSSNVGQASGSTIVNYEEMEIKADCLGFFFYPNHSLFPICVFHFLFLYKFYPSRFFAFLFTF